MVNLYGSGVHFIFLGSTEQKRLRTAALSLDHGMDGHNFRSKNDDFFRNISSAEVTENLQVNHLLDYLDELENELEDVKMTR